MSTNCEQDRRLRIECMDLAVRAGHGCDVEFARRVYAFVTAEDDATPMARAKSALADIERESSARRADYFRVADPDVAGARLAPKGG